MTLQFCISECHRVRLVQWLLVVVVVMTNLGIARFPRRGIAHNIWDKERERKPIQSLFIRLLVGLLALPDTMMICIYYY